MAENTHVDGRAGIDAALVQRLLAAQFPQWSELPVTPVEVDGWDNRTYRLGDDMTVRLPTAEGYTPAVEKENRWLPVLAPHLPVPIPVPLGIGKPAEGYPYPWSIRRWLHGETADPQGIDDLPTFAIDVANFLLALQAIDATGGPAAGAHSFFRGDSLTHYDAETRACLAKLEGHIDTAKAGAVWEAALAARFDGPPVWFHGDIAHGNLLVENGRLVAVIDFGTSGVGDPSCDLVIAWTMFSGDSREAFRKTVARDDGTWARARGWAIWKAMLVMSGNLDGDQRQVALNRHVINEVIADHDLLG
ncbi:aminoglycoside phosphotransferase family protein [Flindersiella endophytica]